MNSPFHFDRRPDGSHRVLGFRLLTDPTFDAPGEYRLPQVTLTKTARPAVTLADIGPVDACCSATINMPTISTIPAAHSSARRRACLRRLWREAARWASRGSAMAICDVDEARRRMDAITATPARHGPAGIEPLSGDVIGFVLAVGNRGPAQSTSPATRCGMTALPKSRAVSGGHGGVVCRVCANARAVSSHHGHQRRHGNRAGVSERHDRARSQQRLGAFQAKRGRLAEVVRRARLGSRLRLLQPGVATPIAPLQ